MQFQPENINHVLCLIIIFIQHWTHPWVNLLIFPLYCATNVLLYARAIAIFFLANTISMKYCAKQFTKYYSKHSPHYQISHFTEHHIKHTLNTEKRRTAFFLTVPRCPSWIHISWSPLDQLLQRTRLRANICSVPPPTQHLISRTDQVFLSTVERFFIGGRVILPPPHPLSTLKKEAIDKIYLLSF